MLYLIWLITCDILLFPFRLFRLYHKKNYSTQRRPILNSQVLVCVHEWGGYSLSRKKHINKSIPDFTCGLKYQLQRFDISINNIELTITMSDINLCKSIEYIQSKCHALIAVKNRGMDFSGYSYFYSHIKNRPNSYVILSNSSINSDISAIGFLDSYIQYMEDNPDVGMLGISCCSKCIQTIIRYNFTPHIQSFFILTTIDVLNEVVSQNKGQFPGANINNKQLLIRQGEIKLSSRVLDLGYHLAVVTEKGVFKFDGNYQNYPFPYGDYRCYTQTPNRIFLI